MKMLLDELEHFIGFLFGDVAIAFCHAYEECGDEELGIIRFRATAGFDDECCALEPGFCGFFNQCIVPLLFIRRPLSAACDGFWLPMTAFRSIFCRTGLSVYRSRRMPARHTCFSALPSLPRFTNGCQKAGRRHRQAPARCISGRRDDHQRWPYIFSRPGAPSPLRQCLRDR